MFVFTSVWGLAVPIWGCAVSIPVVAHLASVPEVPYLWVSFIFTSWRLFIATGFLAAAYRYLLLKWRLNVVKSADRWQVWENENLISAEQYKELLRNFDAFCSRGLIDKSVPYEWRLYSHLFSGGVEQGSVYVLRAIEGGALNVGDFTHLRMRPRFPGLGAHLWLSGNNGGNSSAKRPHRLTREAVPSSDSVSMSQHPPESLVSVDLGKSQFRFWSLTP